MSFKGKGPAENRKKKTVCKFLLETKKHKANNALYSYKINNNNMYNSYKVQMEI